MLSRASWYQAASTAVFALLSLWLWPALALAIGVGGALMTANFWAMRVFLARALAGSNRRLAYGIALSVKFVVVLGLLAVLVLVLQIDPIGIAIGMMSLFVGIGLAVAHGAFDSEPEQPAQKPLES
jgi:hypothetical protein